MVMHLALTLRHVVHPTSLARPAKKIQICPQQATKTRLGTPTRSQKWDPNRHEQGPGPLMLSSSKSFTEALSKPSTATNHPSTISQGPSRLHGTQKPRSPVAHKLGIVHTIQRVRHRIYRKRSSTRRNEVQFLHSIKYRHLSQ